MTKAHYYTCTTSANDTGFDSYSVPFHSSNKSGDVYRSIQNFKREFPKSKMDWKVGVAYIEAKK